MGCLALELRRLGDLVHAVQNPGTAYLVSGFGLTIDRSNGKSMPMIVKVGVFQRCRVFDIRLVLLPVD